MLRRIEALELDAVKHRLMQTEGGADWDAQRADAAELAYRRYLVLRAKYPRLDLSPTEEADAFWHAHILDTRKYARDCRWVFGRYLHHVPSQHGNDVDDASRQRAAARRMAELHEREFGVPPMPKTQCLADPTRAWEPPDLDGDRVGCDPIVWASPRTAVPSRRKDAPWGAGSQSMAYCM
ncbi:hypothetical protein AAW51_5460 [Caldimonas brevitalea]|uniref:Glycine-rich domain-containing protein-like n=1 Tax=Caldimonas brevitalea TaxID=413882 RepID=A0A0G3BXN4_9BURK|nr:hypothetical protein AAW51_5460 [Caldimonas brevitalea]